MCQFEKHRHQCSSHSANGEQPEPKLTKHRTYTKHPKSSCNRGDQPGRRHASKSDLEHCAENRRVRAVQCMCIARVVSCRNIIFIINDCRWWTMFYVYTAHRVRYGNIVELHNGASELQLVWWRLTSKVKPVSIIYTRGGNGWLLTWRVVVRPEEHPTSHDNPSVQVLFEKSVQIFNAFRQY